MTESRQPEERGQPERDEAAEEQAEAAEEQSAEAVEDLEVTDEEISERIRGGRRAISIPF